MSSAAGQAGEAGADAEGDQSLDASVVFHTKAEMNAMIASPFAATATGAAAATATTEESNGVLANIKGKGKGSMGNAFLLYGADNIRGAHVLRSLLLRTRRTVPGAAAPVVYCLGSWKTAEGGLARIEKAMRELQIWKPAFAQRIRPLPGGDVMQARFRLPPPVYARLVAEVGTIVHTGSALLWTLDPPLVAENVSALMNMVALARANGASLHYLSSTWLDAYDSADPETDDRRLLQHLPEIQVKRRAEEVLHFAAHQHGLRCAVYRLPFLAPNTQGGFSRRHAQDESFVTKTLAILADAGLLVANCADDVVPLISADVAGDFVAARVLGGGRGRGRARGRAAAAASVYSPTLETQCVTMSTLVDWIEQAEAGATSRGGAAMSSFQRQGLAMQSRPINRRGTRAEMVAYFERKLQLPALVETYTKLFFEVMPALSRAASRLVARARRQVSPLQYALFLAKRRGQGLVGAARGEGERVMAAEGMQRYIAADPLLLWVLAAPGGDGAKMERSSSNPPGMGGTQVTSETSEASMSEIKEEMKDEAEASGPALEAAPRMVKA
jgi:thioester reductase-like protein